jgi:hypothetical protein
MPTTLRGVTHSDGECLAAWSSPANAPQPDTAMPTKSDSPSSMHATPDVSVIIVSYNTRELLRECIESILCGQGNGITVEVIVVDNASADGSAPMVAERFPPSAPDCKPRQSRLRRGVQSGAGDRAGDATR